MDERISEEILQEQVYPLPQTFEDQVVVDIGAHIGFFSNRAAEMGAKAVYSFEAHPENFSLLNENMKGHPQCKVYNRPVWRSDGNVSMGLDVGRFAENSGMSHVKQSGEFKVETIGLDRIFEIVQEDGYDRIDYLKMDCEGSEFPVLFTCSCMDSIDTIAAEIHPSARGYMDFGDLSYDPSVQGVKDFLFEHGYEQTKVLVTNFCWETPLYMLYAIR